MVIKRDHVRTAGKGRLLEAPDDDRTWSRSLWLELESTIEMENSAWNGARGRQYQLPNNRRRLRLD
jgi:hypothetical protein